MGGLALFLAACAPPAGSPSASETAGSTPSPTAAMSVTPSASAPEITWQAIDRAWTTPLLAVASTGSEVIWSAGPEADGDHAPDLYRYSLDTGSVDMLVRSTSRTSNLLPIAGSSVGYAYVEQVDTGSGLVSWVLWYLARAQGAEPQQLDAMDPGGTVSPAPTIAISDRWLVWASVHEREAGPTSEMMALDLASMRTRTLASSPTTMSEFWFPALDGERLVYGVAERGSGMVFSLDLGGAGDPTRLDTSSRAAMPVVSGDTVVWKESSDNLLNWGSLVRYSLSTGGEQPIRFGAEAQVNYPSIGERFLVAWQWDPTRLYLYDLATNQVITVDESPGSTTESDRRPHVNGRLVAWSHAPEDGDLELRWAILGN